MRRDRDDDEYEPDMPDIEWTGPLIGYLFEIGPTMPGAAGPVSISNQELVAWQALSGVSLKPWEAKFLRQLSREYVAELHRAEKADALAPWEPVEVQPDYSGALKAMKKAFAAMDKL